MPRKPKDEILIEMLFPVGGENTNNEFEQQPGGTTAKGVNVRGREPGTLRARGGSRPGLVRFVNEPVSGAHLIQHLNVIVDPTTEALLDAQNTGVGAPGTGGGGGLPGSDSGNDGVTDPSGQWIVRDGGSGIQMVESTRRLVTITANDQTKAGGEAFAFTGNEFTVTGLEVGDSISQVTFQCAGAREEASEATYTITPSNALGVTITNRTIQSKYRLKYVDGAMTVGAPTPTVTLHVLGRIDGGPPPDGSGMDNVQPSFTLARGATHDDTFTLSAGGDTFTMGVHCFLDVDGNFTVTFTASPNNQDFHNFPNPQIVGPGGVGGSALWFMNKTGGGVHNVGAAIIVE